MKTTSVAVILVSVLVSVFFIGRMIGYSSGADMAVEKCKDGMDRITETCLQNMDEIANMCGIGE